MALGGRGLFLAAIVGVGIAATTQTATPKAVAMIANSDGHVDRVLYEDGVIYGWGNTHSMEINTDGWRQIVKPRP